MKVHAAVLTLALLWPGGALGADEVDFVALAKKLVVDGEYARAIKVLAEVNPEDEEIDHGEVAFLRGFALAKSGKPEPALVQLAKAAKSKAEDGAYWLLRAQVLVALARHDDAIDILERKQRLVGRFPGSHLLLAESHRALGRLDRAYAATIVGRRAAPDFLPLARLEIRLLSQLGLFSAADEAAGTYFSAPRPLEQFLAVAGTMINVGNVDGAARLLELARLRYPTSQEALQQLAFASFKQGRVRSAAQLFSAAAVANPAVAEDAAELLRRSGRIEMAILTNAKVSDQKKKIRQRLGLLIEAGRFEEAALLGPRLARLGLLADDELKYALAFADYQTGRLDAAEGRLERVTDVRYFDRVTEMREAIGNCRKDRRSCP